MDLPLWGPVTSRTGNDGVISPTARPDTSFDGPAEHRGSNVARPKIAVTKRRARCIDSLLQVAVTLPSGTSAPATWGSHPEEASTWCNPASPVWLPFPSTLPG